MTIRSKTAGRIALIVDDNEEMGFVIQCMLETMDFGVERAANGYEGVMMSDATDYSLIMMDIEMPVMDGLLATKAIRDHEFSDLMAPVPIIGITAHKDLATKLLCQLAGMDDVLCKPFLMSQLEEAVGRFHIASIN